MSCRRQFLERQPRDLIDEPTVDRSFLLKVDIYEYVCLVYNSSPGNLSYTKIGHPEHIALPSTMYRKNNKVSTLSSQESEPERTSIQAGFVMKSYRRSIADASKEEKEVHTNQSEVLIQPPNNDTSSSPYPLIQTPSCCQNGEGVLLDNWRTLNHVPDTNTISQLLPPLTRLLLLPHIPHPPNTHIMYPPVFWIPFLHLVALP